MRTLKLVPFHIATPTYKTDNDALSTFLRDTGVCFLPDRFGYLNQFAPYHVSSDVYEFPRKDTTHVFSDLMDKRSEELATMAKSSDKLMYVLYSGGVDSTAILLGLIKAFDGDFDKLRVVYTQSSVLEYPAMFDHLRKLGIRRFKVDGTQLERGWAQLAETDYVVTGFPADQLFGSIYNQGRHELYFTDWRNSVASSVAIQQFEAAFEHYGLPIKTLGEFAWFVNFACKWDHVCNNIATAVGKPNGFTINFFETQDFADWSVSNFDKLHRYSQGDTKHYKIELKDYCYKHFKDDVYRDEKGKMGSIGYAKSVEDAPNNVMCRPAVHIVEGDGTIVSETSKFCVRQYNAHPYKERLLTQMLSVYRKENIYG